MGKAKRLKAPSEEEHLSRRIRTLERDLANARAKIRDEAKLRKQAEAELDDAARIQEAITETRGRAKGRAVKASRRNGKPVSTAVICATDWHLEENVDPEVINGLNEFNLDIAKRRVRKLWEKSLYLIEFTRAISNVRDIVLWLGGDVANGRRRTGRQLE